MAVCKYLATVSGLLILERQVTNGTGQVSSLVERLELLIVTIERYGVN